MDKNILRHGVKLEDANQQIKDEYGLDIPAIHAMTDEQFMALPAETIEKCDALNSALAERFLIDAMSLLHRRQAFTPSPNVSPTLTAMTDIANLVHSFARTEVMRFNGSLDAKMNGKPAVDMFIHGVMAKVASSMKGGPAVEGAVMVDEDGNETRLFGDGQVAGRA